jgi:hypothetical protein
MAKGFKHGAGGTSLNFKVISNPKPETATENTIWVDTDVKITGWDFSAAEPANPVEGMVWFPTGTASSVAFNALKENSVMVYPLSAKQYSGGAWVGKTAKSYRNGEFVDWFSYYYQNGNTFDSVTGGYYLGSGATLEADSIKLYFDGQGEAIARTVNKVDLSGISTLYLKASVNVESSYDNRGHLLFYASENAITGTSQDIGVGATVDKEYVNGTNTEETISLDVSGITGSKYLVFALKNPNKYTKTTIRIKESWG